MERKKSLRKAVWRFLTKLNINLPHNPAIPLLLDLAKRKEDICPHKELYTNVDSSSIHTCGKAGTTETAIGLVNKTSFQNTMEYYPVLKRNELSVHVATWKKLKTAVLREGQT